MQKLPCLKRSYWTWQTCFLVSMMVLADVPLFMVMLRDHWTIYQYISLIIIVNVVVYAAIDELKRYLFILHTKRRLRRLEVWQREEATRHSGHDARG